ncbi:MAG: biotin/lipoyl-containing protein, partial [Pseudomonadota bacterium]
AAGALEAETALGTVVFRAHALGAARWQVQTGAESLVVHLHTGSDTAGCVRTVSLARPGRRIRFEREDPQARGAEDAAGDSVAAPLPGLVKSLAVAPGDAVVAGQVLAVMEAMKMEHSLLAPRDGRVADVAAEPGEQVAEGTLLVTLEPEAGDEPGAEG